MKTLASFILAAAFVIVAGAFTWAQIGTSATSTFAEPAPGDTIRFYSVSTSAQTKNGQTTYKVNGLPATKTEYDKYKQSYDSMANCKPCYMRIYSIDDKLLSEGDRYTDCRVGYWKEYYPDGSVKVIGQYKTDETGRWKNNKVDKWCSIRDGKWVYYGQNGEVDSIVNYVNNKRIK